MSPRKKKSQPASESTSRRMRSHRKKIWNIALGVFFFVLGLIGILIPVMPQLIFFFLSLVFFSRASPRLRRAVRRFRKRHPKVERAYQTWRKKSREKRLQVIRRAREMGRDIEEKVEEVLHKDSA